MDVLKNDLIFIHIPKTGGTTLNCALTGKYWQSETNYNYRHIVFKDKSSNSGDIFHPNTFLKNMRLKRYL